MRNMMEKLIVFGPEGRPCQLKEETLCNVFNFLNHPFIEATGAACPKLQEAEHSIADLLFTVWLSRSRSSLCEGTLQRKTASSKERKRFL
jgi:hypothetical protein